MKLRSVLAMARRGLGAYDNGWMRQCANVGGRQSALGDCSVT